MTTRLSLFQNVGFAQIIRSEQHIDHNEVRLEERMDLCLGVHSAALAMSRDGGVER